MTRFYGHFAAAYGTFWFFLLVAAVLSQSHIDMGVFGMCGFPIIAALYALCRIALANDQAAEIARLQERVWRLERQIKLQQSAIDVISSVTPDHGPPNEI
jgi:hypothetical protein